MRINWVSYTCVNNSGAEQFFTVGECYKIAEIYFGNKAIHVARNNDLGSMMTVSMEMFVLENERVIL